MSVATNNNFQDYDPRQRLTGAVVLILLAIVLLPMLLNKTPDPQVAEKADTVVMEVTKEGKKVFVSRISSITEKDVTEVQQQKNGPEAKKSDPKENAKQSSALIKPMSKTPAKPATATKSNDKTGAKKSTTAQPVKKQPAIIKSKATAVGGWIVQVGVFSQSANASKKVSELKKKGFAASSGKVKSPKGTVTKVWIGPFKDRKTAEKMQDRLHHKTRQRGIVVKNNS
jgi:DedD protein